MNRSTIEQISKDIGHAVDDAAGRLQDFGRGAEHAYEALAEATRALAKAAQALTEEAGRYSRSAVSQTAQRVESHPLAAVAAAGGFAMLLGYLLTRLRR